MSSVPASRSAVLAAETYFVLASDDNVLVVNALDDVFAETPLTRSQILALDVSDSVAIVIGDIPTVATVAFVGSKADAIKYNVDMRKDISPSKVDLELRLSTLEQEFAAYKAATDAMLDELRSELKQCNRYFE